MYRLGLGAYHTGVQVGNTEYTFSTAGEQQHKPKDLPPEECEYVSTIELGEIRIDRVREVRNELKEGKFKPGTYNLVNQNCNHYSQAIAKKLFDITLPGYINRAARFGARVVKDVNTKDEKAKKGKNSKEKQDKKEKQKQQDTKQGQGKGEKKPKQFTEQQQKALDALRSKKKEKKEQKDEESEKERATN